MPRMGGSGLAVERRAPVLGRSPTEQSPAAKRGPTIQFKSGTKPGVRDGEEEPDIYQKGFIKA